MKATGRVIALGFVAVICWTGLLFADYILLLKNGRRITVKSYQVEGGMIKFSGFGGEMSIAREQVQSIMQAVEGERGGMDLLGSEQPPGKAVGAEQVESEVAGAGTEEVAGPGAEAEGEAKVEEAKVEEKGGEPVSTKEKVLTPEEKLAQERAKEEKEYQKRIREITERIKAMRDRYSLATRGRTGPEPGLLDSQEAIRARTAELNSRLKDRQYNPAGPSDAAGVKLSTPSPFAGTPPKTRELHFGKVIPRVRVSPPPYTPKEKRLSELRRQIEQLQKERKRLIQEMRQKNFDTGSLFLE